MIKANPSYWEKAFDDHVYDLIVIGAGLVGQSTAYFFKQKYPDASVLVIERGLLPRGASTRNAGFTCIGSATEHLANLKSESEESLKAKIKRRYSGLELLKSTLSIEHIEYEECGGVEIFTEVEKFDEAKASLSKFNSWVAEFSGEKEAYTAGTYLAIPAIYNKVEGMLHSGKMMKRLHALCIESGIEFRWGLEVTDLQKDQVQTRQGLAFNTEAVIVTINAFAQKLLPEIQISPGRGYIMLTKPLGNLEWHGTFHYDEGYVYFRNIGDDQLLLGGGRNVDYDGETTTEFGVNSNIKNYLVKFANEVLELPNGWEIEMEWSGIMGFTHDHQPILRKTDQGIVVACGLNGMGVALGMQIGKEAAELVLD